MGQRSGFLVSRGFDVPEPPYHLGLLATFHLAQRALCAAAIRLRPAAEMAIRESKVVRFSECTWYVLKKLFVSSTLSERRLHQSSLSTFSRLCIYQRDLLHARVIITTYNQHVRLLPSRALVWFDIHKVYSGRGSRHCHVINNRKNHLAVRQPIEAGPPRMYDTLNLCHSGMRSRIVLCRKWSSNVQTAVSKAQLGWAGQRWLWEALSFQLHRT